MLLVTVLWCGAALTSAGPGLLLLALPESRLASTAAMALLLAGVVAAGSRVACMRGVAPPLLLASVHRSHSQADLCKASSLDWRAARDRKETSQAPGHGRHPVAEVGYSALERSLALQEHRLLAQAFRRVRLEASVHDEVVDAEQSSETVPRSNDLLSLLWAEAGHRDQRLGRHRIEVE